MKRERYHWAVQSLYKENDKITTRLKIPENLATVKFKFKFELGFNFILFCSIRSSGKKLFSNFCWPLKQTFSFQAENFKAASAAHDEAEFS